MTNKPLALTSGSRFTVDFDPDIRSDAALSLFLAKMLHIIEDNEPGIINNQNTEFLHDFRVACRRSRSIIGQLKQVLPKHTSYRLTCNLAWINKVTGPGRDLDVFLIKFTDYQHKLPSPLQGKLEPLRIFLVNRKKEEYKKIAQLIQSTRYLRFKEFMRNYTSRAFSARTTLKRASLPIPENCNVRIWRVYRRALKEGSCISKHSPNEELHDLRKTCKKLRYLLEFCRCLYREEDISKIIHVLKLLQDTLGEFHDYGVEVNTLHNYTSQTNKNESANAVHILAVSYLIEYLDNQESNARMKYKDTFDRFSNKENRAMFKQLFKPAGL